MNDAEHHLWQRTRNKQVNGVQFYRQRPLLNYIVDFYCPKVKLVIELDGGQHFEDEHPIKDRERDVALEAIGLQVLLIGRYWRRRIRWWGRFELLIF